MQHFTAVTTQEIDDTHTSCLMSCAGEYVAPERIEGTLKKASVVQQVYVYGNSFESCVVAVVVPDEKVLRYAKIGRPHQHHHEPYLPVQL